MSDDVSARAREDVQIMAERVASLYYHFVQTLRRELGDEKARELTRKAILAYGTETGEKARKKVQDQGLPINVAHYKLSRDLPSVGWTKEHLRSSETENLSRVTYCPFAEAWNSMPDFASWGRLYCYVDQAKYRAFHKDITCVHDKNLLDGDDCCLLRVETEGRVPEQS